MFGQDDRGGELEGIGRAKRVKPEQSHRLISYPLERRYFGPFTGSFAQPFPSDP